MHGKTLSTPLRVVVVVAVVSAVTFADFRLLHVNSATAGFTYLVLILGLATRVGWRESITASFLSVAAYNFFFLPPVESFTIADPQNWVAFVAFLATAITASQLSSSARLRAEEARARQEELQRMYDFSRGLILGKEDYSLADQVVKQIVESFAVENACFYDSSTGLISRVESSEPFHDATLAEVAASGRISRNSGNNTLIVPVRVGGASLGSLGVAGQVMLSEVALQAIAQLVAIAIERARAQETANRMAAAQQNEQLKSTLLDALAHEFKTPLTAVKAATTTLLSSQMFDGLDQRELVTIVDEETDRMTQLVSDSIELARTGPEPLVLRAQPCSLEALISSALHDLRALFEGREVKKAISLDLPPILADSNLTKLALRQILTNAVKYSPGNSPIGVEARTDDRFAVVSISSLGAGIAKADQHRIFDRFYRGPDVRSRIPGTGLGLSITREIIEAQGGGVGVHSEVGHGATFSMSFPLYGPPMPAGKVPSRNGI